MGRNIRVKTWEEFKSIALKKKPKTVVYIIAQSIPAKNLTSLKLLLPIENIQYIFTDTAKDNKLRRTKIPIRRDKKGNQFLEDSDIKNYLKKEFQKEDLKIFSYWTA